MDVEASITGMDNTDATVIILGGLLSALGTWIEVTGYPAGTAARNAMNRINRVRLNPNYLEITISFYWVREVWEQFEKIWDGKLQVIRPEREGLTSLLFKTPKNLLKLNGV
jgi:hypothetical protein